jgi:pSer/pThr/pTyr-binding forkhead associated (FHA) protein
VSRQHAKLSWSRGRFMIEDLGSANGTTVNGKRIKRTMLGAGDRIGLGIYEIEMVAQRDRDLKATMMLATDDMDMNLHLVGENQSVPLNQEVNIGKGMGVDLIARGPFVRQYHARVQVEGSGIHHLICPGHATVRLNGTKVKGAYLQEGDEIGVGRSKFRVVSIPAEKST